MTATLSQLVYEEANITMPIQGSWIANDGTLYAGSFQTLYKSTDEGLTWQQLITFNGSNPGISCIFVNKMNYLFASPNSNATSSELGLWRSIDGGQTWSHILTLPVDCSILSMTEDSSGNLFAGVYTTAFYGNTADARIYKSTDNGTTWASVYYD